MTVILRVWRQANPTAPGRLETYTANDVHPDMSFLEMLDVVNEELTKAGKDPIAFDSDCREGICGSCGLVINGLAHGPDRGASTCQVHMRRFKNGDTITVEPFRARAFPVLKDLVVDRSALDRIIAAGGYVSMNVGGAPDGNSIPVLQERGRPPVYLGESHAPGAAAPGGARALSAGGANGRADGCGGIRGLFERG
jgi:succinate dehydrogenase / fumarate reductase iron-sulfur subunit